MTRQAEDPSSAELCPQQIRAVILGAIGGFQKCFEIALNKDPTAKGGITIAARVTQGKVEVASVSSSSLGSPEVEKCMLAVFDGLSFPTAGKPTNISFPFVFKGR